MTYFTLRGKAMGIRKNPFEELEALFDRMSRQFEEASRNWPATDAFEWGSTTDTMPVDLVDHGDAFVATVDLPGFTREDVEITVSDHTLHIDADRESNRDESGERYLRRERHQEHTHRSLSLPAAVDTEAVTAKMKNGVLTITLPKLEVDEGRHIEIE